MICRESTESLNMPFVENPMEEERKDHGLEAMCYANKSQLFWAISQYGQKHHS